ncbi:recombination-associated protein RdgC [Desulfobotulus sp.]|jgi:DNA recombination-dependent growth factor C|uniref:recombination-associated protein RdgC n=1 Tax=Desulfobotulus sp. TaxID=1940337 RepID=UPI002A3685BF|nr:recombination-associated protein RdgC [Desulfobotulus sp.]MDY0163464.1 recombination-associated protein RdgC [Desulfobotulus sp.]
MALLSNANTLTRYRVEGKDDDISLESIREKLQHNRFPEIEDPAAVFTSGWTPFESHYLSDFSEKTIVFANFILFCLRIDKKSVPSKILKKQMILETQKRLKESGKEFLSKNEKKALKEDLEASLLLRIPASPNIYDLLWDMEKKEVYFFSSQKASNEEVETLFTKTFGLHLIRIFPYTAAMHSKTLTDMEKDRFTTLSPVRFSE